MYYVLTIIILMKQDVFSFDPFLLPLLGGGGGQPNIEGLSQRLGGGGGAQELPKRDKVTPLPATRQTSTERGLPHT